MADVLGYLAAGSLVAIMIVAVVLCVAAVIELFKID